MLEDGLSHIWDERGRAKTLNHMGYSHKIPTSATLAFYQHAKQTKGKLADIGCAYGFDTLEALKCDAHVVVIDKEPAHLEMLNKVVPENMRQNLTTMVACFPEEVDFKDNTFDGILLSRVLIFLKPEEMEFALSKVFDWLKPGGKIFIASPTPFIAGWDDAKNIWEEQMNHGQKWPGYIDDLWSAIPETQTFLPQSVLLLDEHSLKSGLSEAGFVIEEINYDVSSQGKPTVCAVGLKPL